MGKVNQNERTGVVTSINQLRLSDNERSTLFSGMEEVVVSFLMLNSMVAIVPGQEEATPIFKPSSQIFNHWCFGSKLYFGKGSQTRSFLYMVNLSRLELLDSVEYRYFDHIVSPEGSLIYERRTVYDDVERLPSAKFKYRS
jgi:hypothetical protein